MIQPRQETDGFQRKPPQWPLKLLRFFVKKEYVEEIEGDMEEIFYENVEQLSYRKAKRIYTWEMVKLLRPALMRNMGVIQNLNQYGMFKNYFKVSLRSLMKNPVNSFINVFGLAVAIGVCVFGYAFARWTVSTDQFHENKHSVYLTTFFANRDGSAQQFGTTPRPLGEMLKGDFAQIKNVCRVEDRNVVMKYEDNVFHERVRYTDAAFLEMFTFPLKWGTSGSLKDINSIILSEEMSIKYFGNENPIGQDILMIFGKDRSKAFKITGVAAEFPKSRTISFDFLINFENFRTSDLTAASGPAASYDFHDWNAFVNATLIQVAHPSDLKSLEQGMEKYRKLQNEAVKEDWAVTSFAFEPLATLHQRSEYIRDDISRSSKSSYISVMFICIIAVFLLALACFNYINIGIASAAKRLKEIGVRKSIGATKRAVIVQFLSENVVITLIALMAGVVIGVTIFIPGFEKLWDLSLDFRFTDPWLWIYLPVILLLTSIASGIYPSLYISRFQVVGILKGAVKFGQKNPLAKIFLSFQLIMACVFITMAVMFTQNNSYLAKRSWGYNNGETLYAVVPDQASYEQLSARMSQHADVLSISGSTHHIGKKNTTTVLHFPQREYEVDQLSVDAKYFETMGLELKAGRVFNDHDGSDRHAVVVNELLGNNLHWENPVGQTFMIDSVQFEVVGVVKDFHNYSFSKMVRPIIFRVAEKAEYKYLSLRARSGSEIETYRALQKNWSELFPETPFEGGLQQDVWGFYYEEIKIHGLVWRVFSFIAVTLAALGLYGLIRLNVEGRTKEFSIRKVLGAGLKNIAVNVTSQYVAFFAAALIIGAPAGYILGKFLIEFAYTYHMPVTISGVSIAVTILVFVLMITVSTQIGKALKTNPVDGLKVE